MKTKDAILAVDIGTQSLRACILEPDLSLSERQQIPYTPQMKSGNRVEMDAEILWQALIHACGKLMQRERVGLVSFSTPCPSLVPMDRGGNPLHPIILHLDRRSYPQAKWALDRVSEEAFLDIAGNLPVPGGISVTSLLWIREHVPEIYDLKDVCFGHAVTFIIKRLTDRFVMDPSNASFTGLFDTVGYGDWDERLLAPLEIDRGKLPDITPSTTVVDELTDRSSRRLGLPKGIPVVIGANDTTCAAVGAGVLNAGDIMNTSGTVEILVVSLEKPLVSRNHLLRTHAYPGKWLAMRTVGAGGISLEWFRKNFCRELTKEAFYNEYLSRVLAEKQPPNARFHPYLAGDRHRVRTRSGGFSRLTLGTSRDEMLLALNHGIVSFQMKSLSEWAKSIPLSDTICHVGGGASKAYTDYKQGMLKEYHFRQMGETTSTGAGKLALDALGRGAH